MAFILQWIDVIWLPLAYFVVHKDQRLWSLAFVASCMLMMRMQTELMISIGYPQGILNFANSHVYTRGLGVYSIFYVLYLILAYYSKDTRGVIFLAASISIFFMALLVSTFAMVV